VLSWQGAIDPMSPKRNALASGRSMPVARLPSGTARSVLGRLSKRYQSCANSIRPHAWSRSETLGRGALSGGSGAEALASAPP